MITEDYVSFEIAKLLKEKGFDEECSCFYNNIGYGAPGLEVDGQLYYKNSYLDDEEYAAPTLQMTMKWLREIHHLFIWFSLNPGVSLPYYYQIFKTDRIQEYVVRIDDNVYGSYEQACESAIKYCLENLI